jgi:hypothetical protein
MRNGAIFWGVILIVIGGIILLSNLGLLPANIWQIIWPLGVIALGFWLLWGIFRRPTVQNKHVEIGLRDAQRAVIKLRHGAGRMSLGATGEGVNLLAGDFGGGVIVDERMEGDLLKVKLKTPEQWYPTFNRPGTSLDWNLLVKERIPIDLDISTGASDARLDLTRLMIPSLKLSSGASSVQVQLPESAADMRAEFKTGAASLILRVPAKVAAQIKVTGGLTSIRVDSARFPKQGGVYQSPDYEAAVNKVTIRVETGVGSVDIR